MSLDHFLRNSGLDRYDRNARLYPAFISLLPLFVVIAIWMPQVWTLLGSVTSLVVTCGLTYGLAQIVRHLGRQVEARLGVRAGRAKSAALLTHTDPTIPRDTKLRYHRYLAGHGIVLPDEETERADPKRAYESCRSAVDWLLEHTRPLAKTSMLHSENIAYGFRRNLLGIKPFAIPLASIALLANSWFLHKGNQDNRVMAGLVLELFLMLTLVVWAAVIRPAFVEDASSAYAQRFLAHCEQTKPQPRPRAPRQRSKQE